MIKRMIFMPACVAALLLCSAATEVRAQGTAEADKAPKALSTVSPEYPKEAFDNNIEATVELLLYIDASGKVVQVDVVTPSAHPDMGFEESAVEAFEVVRFEPATRDGKPVAVKVAVAYDFEIELVEPMLKELIQADYPKRALREGIEDQVVAELDVSETGRVTRVELIEGAKNTEYGFDEGALEAMEKFSYMPATKNGTPVPVTVRFRYTFELPEKWIPVTKRPVNLKIEIKEKGTRKPVRSGFISLQHGDQPAIDETFQDGAYLGRWLEPGEWSILIEADGYRMAEATETVFEDKVTSVTYFIEREYYDVLDTTGKNRGDEGYVYETKETKVEKEVSVQTIEVSEIQRIPGNGGDAIRVVQNMPGVARTTFGTGALVVRGSAPADTRVMLNGAPVPMLYHFGGLSSVVVSDALEEVEFIPGNFSVRHGRVMGGILDVKTRRPNNERFTGFLDTDPVDATFMLEGPVVEGLSFQVSARRSYLDAILKAVLEEENTTLTAAPRYWDYMGRLNWVSDVKPGGKPAHELEIMAYGSNDKMSMLEKGTGNSGNEKFEIQVNMYHVQAQWKYRSKLLENHTLYDYGRDKNFVQIVDQKDELLRFSHTIRDDLTLHLTKWLDLTVGVDVEVGKYKVDVAAANRSLEGMTRGEMYEDESQEGPSVGGGEGGERDDEEIFIEKKKDTFLRPAAFLELGLMPTDKLLFTVGGRFDYDNLSDSSAVDVRGMGLYRMHKYVALKGAVGTFSQPPEEKDLSDVFGNPDLHFQKAIHYSLGTELRMPFYEPLSFEATGFYKDMRDLVAPSDKLVVRDGRTVLERLSNDGEGRVYGGEFMLRHDMANNFFGWISYTLSRSQRRDSRSEPWVLSQYDQTHILTVLGSYKLPKGFQVGLRFRYITGAPYTPHSRGVFDSDSDGYQFVTGKPNSARLESFHQLDIRVDKDFVFKYWILTAYLDVQNVYFHANAELSQYNYDYTERQTIRSIPIMPSVGMRGAF